MKLKAILFAVCAAVLSGYSGTVAAQSEIVRRAQDFVPAVETATGRMIAVLSRSDSDLSAFYYRAMTALCDKTGDNWCEDQIMSVLSDTTNPLGWSRILTYTNEKGEDRTVCALLPPKPNVNAGYAATGLTGGLVLGMNALPTSAEMEAYLWLLHTGSCLWDTGSEAEAVQSNVFAVMAMTLIQGDTQFVGAFDITPARIFVPFRDPDETRWGVNIGERLLLDHWKSQTAAILSASGCTVTVSPSTDLNTDLITRDNSLGTADCSGGNGAGFRNGTVSDQNLWLWTTASAGGPVSMPPEPYVPFAMFPTPADAASYLWQAAGQLAQ